jgi:predicted AAA+ superfamily ATPase
MQGPPLPRLAHRRLERLLATFSSVLVTGPRQAGKSTLLRMQLPGAPIMDLDDIRTSTEVATDPYLALSLRGSPVIIDEVQAYPAILKTLKVLIDQDRGAKGRYGLTGSQVFPLMQGVTESLAGRVGVLELLPLAWKEYGTGLPTERELLSLMLRGGYPELALNANLSRNEWLNSYLTTYVERDVRALQAVQDLMRFRTFLKLLAGRAGDLLNLQELAKDAGISVNTAKDWISLLETTFIVFRLAPWHRNASKRLVKTPKLYFWDTGLLTFLAGIDTPERLASDRQIGHIFENYVITELRKQAMALCARQECFFYRTQDGAEVDFLLQTEQGVLACEIKWGSHTNSSDVKALSDLQLDLPITTKTVLCPSAERRVVAPGILQQNWASLELPIDIVS